MATCIISIGLVALAMVIQVASHGVYEGNALSTAAFLADQKLEEVRNAVWTAIPPASDCLGIGPSAAPTSTTCTRTAPTACVSGTSCTTFPDEAAVTTHPSYRRTVRVIDCAVTACAGVAHGDMRLVRVSVTYRPMTGKGGQGASTGKSAVVEMLIAKRH